MKLGDFGISKRVLNQSTALRTEVGTRAFSAPETTPDDYEETFQYTNAVDMWSLGCVIYNVLAHCLPYKNSQAKSSPFPAQPLKDRVDDQGINLLECLLRVDPSTRWTAQKAVEHPWLEASSKASFAAAEDAVVTAKSVAQPERPNESQERPNRPDEHVDMPIFSSSMGKTSPKPVWQTGTPINQSTPQSSGHRGKNGLIDSSSNNDGRRRTTSNTLISPRYRRSDSFEDPGTAALTPRRARYRSPKDASRGLHESDTMNQPTLSAVTPTIVSRPPRHISESANTRPSRERASSPHSTDPSWAVILEEMKNMGITEDQIEENADFIRDYIRQRNASEEPFYSPVTPTIVSRPTRQISEVANTCPSRDRALSLDTTDPSWAGILGELRDMGITEDQIKENADFIRDFIQQQRASKKPDSPVTPSTVSRPSNIRLGMSSSSSYDVDKGATQKEPLEKLHHNSVAVRRHQRSEKQATENMDLVTTLGDIERQKGDPEQHKIARALELIRKGVDLEMRRNGETALHLAVRICCSNNVGHGIQILHELLERGADADALDKYGDTALHTAVISSTPGHHENEIEVVRQLLRCKPDVNALGYSSRTPLHYAAWRSCVECIDMLLDAGARVNRLDDFGHTALHFAALKKEQGEIIARKLILAGIDIDVIDDFGETALDIARRYKSSGIIKVIEEARKQRRRFYGDIENPSSISRGQPRLS